MDMANWQNYRSTVNGMAAVFTANIEDIEKYHNQGLNQIVELTIPYQGDEDGLPAEPEYEILINRIFKILAVILFVIIRPRCIFMQKNLNCCKKFCNKLILWKM